MNTRRFAAALLATAIGAGFGATALAQEGDAQHMDMQAMMEAYEAASQTGPMHELISQGAGMWKVAGEAMGPTGEMAEWTGTIKRTVLFGGRYVQEEWNIDDMMGMSFQGVALMGYNNATEEFEATWIDSLSTGIFMETGSYDESTKTIEMSGEMVDPVMGPMKMRGVTHLVDDKTFTFEMYSTGPDGNEMCTMRATATRGEGDMHRNMDHGKSAGDKEKGKSEENKGKAKGGKGGE